MIRPVRLLAATAAFLLVAVGVAQAEVSAPGWAVSSSAFPTSLEPGGKGELVLQPFNVGAADSHGEVTVTDTLPAGVTASDAGAVYGKGGHGVTEPEAVIDHSHWVCGIAPGSASPENSVVTCHNDSVNLPSLGGGGGPPTGYESDSFSRQPAIGLAVHISPELESGTAVNQMDMSGGGALNPFHATDPITIGSPAPFGLSRWDGWFSNADGTLDNQAGSVPYAFTTSFDLASFLEKGNYLPVLSGSETRNFVVDLPPGFIGNPQAVKRCTHRQFEEEVCPRDTMVGTIVPSTAIGLALPFLVFNLVPPPGTPAEFAFVLQGIDVFLTAHIRTGGDYGVTTRVDNIPQKEIISSVLTLWGTPNDPSHNRWRSAHNGGCSPEGLRKEYVPANGGNGGCWLGPHPQLRPFLRLPTACGAPTPFPAGVEGWLPSYAALTEPLTFFSHDNESEPLGLIGCNQLPFAPTITSKPTTTVADAPTGLEFDLHLPQPEAVKEIESEEPPTNEVQSITVKSSSGQFRLVFGKATTPDLPFDATAEEVQSTLGALATIGEGNVSVSGGPGDPTGSTPYAVTFEGALGTKNVEPLIGLSGTSPLENTPSVVTLVEGAEGHESIGAEAQLHEADLKEAKVILPKGIAVNPSSANGLGACSPAQFGLTSAVGAPVHTTPGPATCPDAAKIGTVTIQTPLLAEHNEAGEATTPHLAQGGVYLAQPFQNPFDSLLAIYIAVSDPESGTVLKLAGQVKADPNTGQLTTTFAENPQLPFEDFHLDFFKGAGAPLRTPQTCGEFHTTTDMTPWSTPEGADAFPTDSFALTQSPTGAPCATSEAQLPSKPNFEAGTIQPKAGAYSPFVLHLARADGSQEISAIDATAPEGLIGKLAGVAECSDAQIAVAQSRSNPGDGAKEIQSPSCPANSLIGKVSVGAGAGPAPYYTSGKAYLAGPYKGAPLSVEIITPAVAGPYDLGVVAVRTAVYLNPETAQFHVVSDPIPHILQGIPLDLRSINLQLDRNQFMLNPTSCAKKQITGTASLLTGQSASLASPFQVGDCAKLGFEPKLAIHLSGSTKRAGTPALRATLTYPSKGAYANIAKASVTLPASEYLDNAHIKTICTRVQFAEGTTPGEKCPPNSIYGFAKATTPLLDGSLEGPVYLRSSSHQLPDLVAALNGQIDVVLDGTIDSVHGGIRNRFEVVPDAPVTKFTLEMQGGKKGLLENHENLCAEINRATAKFTAQNGLTDNYRPVVTNDCKGKARHKSKHKKKRHGAG
jgi:hypothetical protein